MYRPDQGLCALRDWSEPMLGFGPDKSCSRYLHFLASRAADKLNLDTIPGPLRDRMESLRFRGKEQTRNAQSAIDDGARESTALISCGCHKVPINSRVSPTGWLLFGIDSLLNWRGLC
jgi:hypothetical protein